MRCLGRLISLFFLLLLLGAGWLYRDEIVRQVHRITDPMGAARAVGTPSAQAARAGREKLATLRGSDVDSIVLTSSEFGSLLLATLPGAFGAADSVKVELGERRVQLSGLVRLGKLSQQLVTLLKLNPEMQERVTLAGSLTPVRTGVAEWGLDRVTLKGVPLPADLIARLLREAGLDTVDGRIQVPLPEGVTSFRVRQGGAVFYSSPAR